MKRWTEEQIKILTENIQSKSFEELAQLCGVSSPAAVRAKIIHLGLVKQDIQQKHSWSKEDCDYIRENYLTKTFAEIGEHLGLGENQVKHKANNMGCCKKKERTDVIIAKEKKGLPPVSRPKAIYNNQDVTKLLDYYADMKTA